MNDYLSQDLGTKCYHSHQMQIQSKLFPLCIRKTCVYFPPDGGKTEISKGEKMKINTKFVPMLKCKGQNISNILLINQSFLIFFVIRLVRLVNKNHYEIDRSFFSFFVLFFQDQNPLKA